MAAVQALEMITGARDGLLHRMALAREPAPDEAGGPSLRRFAGELAVFGEPVRRMLRRHPAVTTARPRTVMLLPGFATHPIRMRYMARRLEAAGG